MSDGQAGTPNDTPLPPLPTVPTAPSTRKRLMWLCVGIWVVVAVWGGVLFWQIYQSNVGPHIPNDGKHKTQTPPPATSASAKSSMLQKVLLDVNKQSGLLSQIQSDCERNNKAHTSKIKFNGTLLWLLFIGFLLYFALLCFRFYWGQVEKAKQPNTGNETPNPSPSFVEALSLGMKSLFPALGWGAVFALIFSAILYCIASIDLHASAIERSKSARNLWLVKLGAAKQKLLVIKDLQVDIPALAGGEGTSGTSKLDEQIRNLENAIKDLKKDVFDQNTLARLQTGYNALQDQKKRILQALSDSKISAFFLGEIETHYKTKMLALGEIIKKINTTRKQLSSFRQLEASCNTKAQKPNRKKHQGGAKAGKRGKKKKGVRSGNKGGQEQVRGMGIGIKMVPWPALIGGDRATPVGNRSSPVLSKMPRNRLRN